MVQKAGRGRRALNGALLATRLLGAVVGVRE